jgi:DNA-binding transcriptional MerR regulator
MASPDTLIRIGELSRRLGVSADRLRAWERRYALLRPIRTAGGFRLYSRADELRVRAMQRHLAAGLSAAEAAAAALAAAGDGRRVAASRAALDACAAALEAAAAARALAPPAMSEQRARVQDEVGGLIERQPDEVAQLLRSWLADRRAG